MNKTNIPFISIVLLVSVVGLVLILRYESQYQKKKDTLPKEQPIELSGYKTYTLNGCEYVVVGLGQARWGSHKGNCKNPIHYAK